MKLEDLKVTTKFVALMRILKKENISLEFLPLVEFTTLCLKLDGDKYIAINIEKIKDYEEFEAIIKEAISEFAKGLKYSIPQLTKGN